MATFTGTNGEDTITPKTVSAGVTSVPTGSRPSGAADAIEARAGADLLGGGGGDDTITFEGAYSTAYGGIGNDTIRYETSPSSGWAVGAIVDGGSGDDEIAFLSNMGSPSPRGVLSFHGGPGNDRLWSEGTVTTGSYSELLVEAHGQGGNDALYGTAVATFSNVDVYDPGENRENLYGGPARDTYYVFEEADVAIEKPGAGVDKVIVYDSDYTLGANVENLEVDWLGDAFSPPHSYSGNASDNRITAGGGDDTIDGKAGNDTIKGADGADTIFGGVGNDRILGGKDGDWLNGQWGDDILYGHAGDDTFMGEDGNDKLFGGRGNDWFTAGAGDDQLSGHSGRDEMYGDAGDDVLLGGGGGDLLGGGGGNDIFAYKSVTDSRSGPSNHDVILDFVGVGVGAAVAVAVAVADRIDLSAIDADKTTSGNQAFTFIGASALSEPGQVNVSALFGDTLIQANTDLDETTVELEILVKDGDMQPGQWISGDFIL